MEPALTIAIPFFDRLDYLAASIESVLAQQRDDWRLLVCDDSGREQGTSELVRAYGDDRVHYRGNPRNLGMVRNWNQCIDLAETELVTLLHADDRLETDYAERMQVLAARHPDAVAFFCGARIIDARGRPVFSVPDRAKRFYLPRCGDPIVLRGEPGVHALLRGNFIMCPTLCFRKPRLGARRFDASWQQVQDLELTTRLLMEGESLVGTRGSAYVYRRHPESATTIQSESLLRFDEEYRLFDALRERAAALGWRRVVGVARRRSVLRLHLGYRVLHDLLRGAPRRALEKLRFLIRR